MDYLPRIKAPVEREFELFCKLYGSALTHADGLLSQALGYISRRAGKRMRPLLMLLMAKNHGGVTDVTLNAAVGIELLHTASLLHDDVVDESGMRRGQQSVNAAYDNRVAVLVGDFLLSTALLYVTRTNNNAIIGSLASLGRTLAGGELLQLSDTRGEDFSEETYFDVVKQKTAALFEACCAIGALSAGGADDEVAAARQFGQDVGIMFQIRDDIFDYYSGAVIGKPTGNDMAEGKLTLPAIYAINNSGDQAVRELAHKVRKRAASASEIASLVGFSKANGGVDYAERRMCDFRREAMRYLGSHVQSPDIGEALRAYVVFVMDRDC